MIRHVHVVVNAQFEDRIRARICPGDSLKRAGLFIHQVKMAKKGPLSPRLLELESQLTRPEAEGIPGRRPGRRQVWTP